MCGVYPWHVQKRTISLNLNEFLGKGEGALGQKHNFHLFYLYGVRLCATLRTALWGVYPSPSSCTTAGFEALRKAYDKSKSVVLAEGVPGFYVRALAEMEDFVREVCVCACAWTCVSLPIPNSCLCYNTELKVLELGSSRSLCGVMCSLCYNSIHCTTYASIHVPSYKDSFAPNAVLRMSSVRLSPACSCGRTRKASRNWISWMLRWEMRQLPGYPTAMHDNNCTSYCLLRNCHSWNIHTLNTYTYEYTYCTLKYPCVYIHWCMYFHVFTVIACLCVFSWLCDGALR